MIVVATFIRMPFMLVFKPGKCFRAIKTLLMYYYCHEYILVFFHVIVHSLSLHDMLSLAR